MALEKNDEISIQFKNGRKKNPLDGNTDLESCLEEIGADPIGPIEFVVQLLVIHRTDHFARIQADQHTQMERQISKTVSKNGQKKLNFPFLKISIEIQ